MSTPSPSSAPTSDAATQPIPQEHQSPQPATILDLPQEIILEIVESILYNYYGEDGMDVEIRYSLVETIEYPKRFTRFNMWKDVAHLGATCRQMYARITPVLYQMDIKLNNASALLLSAKSGRISSMLKSLDYGADVHTFDETQCFVHPNPYDEHFHDRFGDTGTIMTALHWAAYNNHVEAVRLLLQRGASVDEWTPFPELCVRRKATNQPLFGVYAFIYEHLKAIVSWTDESRLQDSLLGEALPLYYALDQNYQEPAQRASRLAIVVLLLEAGTSMTVHSSMWLNALHLACGFRDLELATLLFSKGLVNANVRDILGNTPMHYLAASEGGEDAGPVLQLLLKHGADINAENDLGYTPLRWCLLWPLGVLFRVAAGEFFYPPSNPYIDPAIVIALIKAGVHVFPGFSNGLREEWKRQLREGDKEVELAMKVASEQEVDGDEGSNTMLNQERRRADTKAIHLASYRQHHSTWWKRPFELQAIEEDHNVRNWDLDDWKLYWKDKLHSWGYRALTRMLE